MDEQLKAFKDFQAFHESSKFASSMTKREAFAMAAMQGYLSGSTCWADPADAGEIARRACVFADALIEALRETP